MGMDKSIHPSTTIVIFLFFTFFLIPFAFSLPFVYFHGIADSCNSTGTTWVKEQLENYSGAQGYCIEIGNGKWDSIFKPIMDQVKIGCEKVKEIDELKGGYNLVGSSQGNMITRGIIQICDDAPPVKNYISLAGPQAGIAAMFDCQILSDNPTARRICEAGERWMNTLGVYNAVVQATIAPSNYIKYPNEMEDYLKGSTYLPKISNEIESTRNSTYKERFASLQNLVLVMNVDDEILIPRETSWFGFYQNGSTTILLPANETSLYKEDWIGLRALDEAGKVTYISSPGGHCVYTSDFLENVIVPYLKYEHKHEHEALLQVANS